MSALGREGWNLVPGRAGRAERQGCAQTAEPSSALIGDLVGASSPSWAMMDMVLDSCLRGPCPCPRRGRPGGRRAVFLAMRPPAGRLKVWGE